MLQRFKSSFSNFVHSDYNNILVAGFLYSYISITTLLAIANTVTGRFDRAGAEIVFLAIMLGGYLYYRKSKNELVGAHFSFWPPAVLIFFQLYHNNFSDFTVIFAIILPLASFFLYNLKRAIISTAVVYSILILLIFHLHTQYTDHPYLNSPTALINTAIGALFIIAFGLLYQLSFYRSYHQMKLANTEKEILLKEIHHRVKNNLNVIASIVDLQARNNDRHSAQQLHLTQSRIESIAIVHEMLYQKKNNFAQINFEDYMHKLSQMVEQLHVMLDVEYLIQGHGITLPVNIMLDLGLITNELLTNSHKHAFANTRKPEIEISLEKIQEHRYRFFYRDNGSGVPDIDEIDPEQSLGLRLIRLSVKKMSALLEFKNIDGLNVIIEFSSPHTV